MGARLRRHGCGHERAGHDGHAVSGRLDQQDGRGHGVDESRSERAVRARSGRQHHPEIVEAAGRRIHEGTPRHPAQPDESHVRHGRRLRISRLQPGRAAADAAADPRRAGAVQSQAGPARASAAHGLQVLRRRRDDSTARVDGCCRPAVRRYRARLGPHTDRHDQQHVRAAAAGGSPETGGPRAQSHRREDGRALARLSRAGRGRPVDHADRSREVPDRSAEDAGRPIDSRAVASARCSRW